MARAKVRRADRDDRRARHRMPPGEIRERTRLGVPGHSSRMAVLISPAPSQTGTIGQRDQKEGMLSRNGLVGTASSSCEDLPRSHPTKGLIHLDDVSLLHTEELLHSLHLHLWVLALVNSFIILHSQTPQFGLGTAHS